MHVGIMRAQASKLPEALDFMAICSLKTQKTTGKTPQRSSWHM
ncbi:hypothetical protein X975_02440, partial [Stegodyphus mimosarum]